MKITQRITVSVACFLLVTCFTAGSLLGQGHNGIASDGKDFYIGYMPGIPHIGTTWSGVTETYYVLVGSYTDGNQVTVNYFDAKTGAEVAGPHMIIQKGRVWKYRLDVSHMQPDRPGEVAQWCAAHVVSTYPVSVQCYSEGSAAGGLLQAIPTPALGKNYVVSSWYDNPLQDNPGFINRDSSSGEFMVIAAFDSTTFTYTPASTTAARKIPGASSGVGSTGRPHPTAVTLRRGQIYWVRSLSVDPSFDISGSTITSNKPCAVISGHERALLGDPSGIWHSLDNDIRNILIAQMTPVEDWDSEYVSIPFVAPPDVTRLLVAGDGQLYRVYASDSTGGAVHAQIGYNSTPNRPLIKFEHPTVTYDSVVKPIEFSSLGGKKMYVVMYDHFQGQHDVDPGEKIGTGKSANENIESGSGRSVLDETTYKMPTEMNLVPQSRWRKSAIWQVPTGSNYKGYQWINVITPLATAGTLQLSLNGGANKTLLSYTPTAVPVPLHPELMGYQLQLVAGDYVMTSSQANFVVYSYGRTQTQYKDGWAYAAPCGEMYGTRDEKNPPSISYTTVCGAWNLRTTDSLPGDEGIADVELLNDSAGFYETPGHVSYNVSLVSTSPNFVVGDSVATFQLQVLNLSAKAYGAVYAVDRAGNDVLFEFNYAPPVVSSVSPILNVVVGSDSCVPVVVRNSQGATVTVDSATLLNDKVQFKVGSSIPPLPAVLQPGDSVLIELCYTPVDTLAVNLDRLVIHSECTHDTIPLSGNGVTPIIVATDADFGRVPIGTTSCREVTLSNIGNAPLNLYKNWLLHDPVHFALADTTQFPIFLQPHQSVQLNFCYTPTTVGFDSSDANWSTNLSGQFLHHNKDYSVLVGAGVPASGVEGNGGRSDALMFEVNPNPAKSNVEMRIDTRSSGKASIGIYDVLGREVRTVMSEYIPAGRKTVDVDLSNLLSGRYLIRLEIDGSRLTRSLTIVR